ncbi:PLP-dependent aminotransferase family protein [Nguyenibacter sp. L1]|uniref:aminotransferase-like domain-containing protein n=1 Tax=Nguyenibacter sp. L1 TaxID=3049350 RepID=UPI002B493E94|nr:PLP-dependent aminotransferase family protein [Nguyenibacter sp. L1]WRH86830.1 PLP-dependent aminotransferase family protein [Nguyenibacter sp. L1]
MESQWFVARLHDRSIRGLSRQVAALIQSGMLPVGTNLPPIRKLAFALGVSPATVSIAWGELRRRNLIEGRGRSGMFVTGTSIVPHPVRRTASVGLSKASFDLTSYTPDLSLLPSLDRAFSLVGRTPNLNAYEDETIIGALRAIASDTWPYTPEDFMACNGGYGGVHDVMHALIPPGSMVAVEDPAPMRVLDILDHLSALIVPVRSDEEGPLPDSLQAALGRGATAFYLQPGLNAITGRAISAARAAELAVSMADAPATWIIEDDALSGLADKTAASLGVWRPEQTIHVRSLSKSLGPDLRIGVISASARIIRELQAFRSFGAGWTSRLLQSAAAWMLTDTETCATIARARHVYGMRRRALADALANHGIDVGGGGGFSLWLPVVNEVDALATLASDGIRVTGGKKCSVGGAPHIRLSFSRLISDQEWLASRLVFAGLR